MRRLLLLLALSGAAWGQSLPFPGPGMPAVASGAGPAVKTITIDHTKVGASDSNDFPMLISGTYAYLADTGHGGAITHTAAQPLYSLAVPADLKFATVSGCASGLLKWEFETYDATTGAVNIWVRIPTLSHTADTVIYMCYGDSSVSTWQGGAKGSVWDANYVAVYHLAGIPLNAADSTGNYDGTLLNSPASVPGKTGRAANFIAASSQAIVTANQLQFSDLTVEAWVKPTGTIDVAYYGRIVDKNYVAGFWLGHMVSSVAGFANAWGGGVREDGPYGHYALVNDDVWTHVAMSRSGISKTVWKNGSPAATANVVSTATDTSPVYIGSDAAGDGYNGTIDEVRISTVARSADWMLAQYNNQNSPSTFYTIN